MSGDTIQTIDITQVILDTTNTLCNTMLTSIDKATNGLIDKIIFITKEITEESYFGNIFGNSPTTGILMLSNCLLVAFVLYYCTRLISSHYSGTEIESPGRFFLRITIATILMNSSLEICNLLLDFTSKITEFFLELGQNIFKVNISFETLISILSNTSSDEFNIFSVDGILTSMLSISSLSLLIGFAPRYIIVKLLILAAPFAFLCLSNSSTEGFFKSWYRSFLAMLLLQIIIAVLLLIPHALLKDDPDSIINKLLLIGSISALLKSGQLVKEFLGGIGISSNFQAGISGLKSFISR